MSTNAKYRRRQWSGGQQINDPIQLLIDGREDEITPSEEAKSALINAVFFQRSAIISRCGAAGHRVV
jgi:hypothetical protein